MIYRTPIGQIVVEDHDYNKELYSFLQDYPDLDELDFIKNKLRDLKEIYSIYHDSKGEQSEEVHNVLLKEIDKELAIYKNKFNELAPADDEFRHYVNSPIKWKKLSDFDIKRNEKVKEEITILFEVVQAYQDHGIEAARKKIIDHNSSPKQFLELNDKYPNFFPPRIKDNVVPELIGKLGPSLTQYERALKLYYLNKAGILTDDKWNKTYFVEI